MDIVKRIDDLKKIIESGKFDTKYAGFTKTEVLLNQHVLTVCESIYEYGKDIAAKITFAYSDPKTGLSKLSEMVIAKAGTPLQEIKEMGILSVMGIKINSNVTVNEEKENVVAVESEKVGKTTEETTETVTETKEVEIVEVNTENTENTDTVEKTEEIKAEEKVTTEENNNDKIKDVTHSADDVEDVLTDNASEIFDKTPSPEDPLNEDFTENVPVGKVVENKVEENKTEETEESNEIGEEFIKTVEKIIETKEKTENEKKETEEKISETVNESKSNKSETVKTETVKEENSSDKEDVPEYKKKELDSIQKGEIDVLVKHLTANKQDKKEVLEKFFKRLDYNKSLKKENSEEILEILVKESQRLANRYTEEILNLMFDEAYKGLIPETQGENLLMNIGSLKVLAVATAIAICEIVLYEMRYL